MTNSSPTTGFRNLGETEVFRNPIFRLMNVTFESPSGDRFDRQIIRHPGAVAVLPLHDDGTITLVSQFRGSIGRNLLEIPAGLLDKAGEDLASAAARELKEEVGLAAQTLQPLITYQAAVGFADEQITVFAGTGLSEVENDLQGPEEDHLTVHRISIASALEMIRNGEITDGKTVIAILLSQFPTQTAYL